MSNNEEKKVSQSPKVDNSKSEIYFQEARPKKTVVHDNTWITERGGTNSEPSDTPNERPHSNS